MITIENHDDEKRLITSIHPFAWIDWPRIFLHDVFQALEKAIYRTMNKPLTQFIHIGGNKYPPIIQRTSYDMTKDEFERFKRYCELSGEHLPKFQQEPDGSYRRVNIGPHWGE